jgi:serine/threonine protein kinase/Tol biopolymer transport system component
MGDLIGKMLGQYQVLRQIGRGGMAIVYEAYQPSLNRYVAIKVLLPYLAADPNFVERFLHEARSAARLEHPNIVAVYDVGRQGEDYYIVMRYLPGEPLNALIQRLGRVPLERAAHIVAQIAAALDYAHAHGIIHRDIKPGNIIVGPGDVASLTDFGIAKAVEGTQLTQSGILVGTPEYMSPEQIGGKKVGPASDLYSLGVVLYQMLAGVTPFRADSMPALLYKHVYEQPAPLRSHISGLPDAIEKVVAKALNKDPEQRFRSAGELAAALNAIAQGRVTDLAILEATAVRAPTRVQTPAMPSQHRRIPIGWLAAGALAAVLLALVMLGGGLSLSPAAPASTPTVMIGLSSTPPAVPTQVPSRDPHPPTLSLMATLPAATSTARPQAQAQQEINVYWGPGRAYPVAGRANAGQTLDLLASDPTSGWWLACCVNGEPAWVEASLVAAVTIPHNLPIATPPSTVTPSPTSTSVLWTATPRSTAATPVPSPRVIPTSTRSPTPQLPLIDLAFIGAHSDGNAYEIYALYEGDPAPHRLTAAPGNDGYPAVHPSRRLVAFEAERNGAAAGSDIWVMNSDGSNQHRLTDTPDTDAQPAFSPDGRSIAFISMRTGTSQIHLMNLDGGAIRQVPAPGWCFGPSFSPDGKQLVFVSTQDSKTHHVYTVNLDGSNLRQVTSESMHYENPSFMADGHTIIMERGPLEGSGMRQVVRVDVDGSGLRNLSNSPTDDWQPAVSWDGRSIAFSRVTGGEPHIWLMDQDGGNQRLLTNLGRLGEKDPAWAR